MCRVFFFSFFFKWPHLSPLSPLPLMRLYCQPLLVSSRLLLKSNSFCPSSFRYDSTGSSLIFNSHKLLSASLFSDFDPKVCSSPYHPQCFSTGSKTTNSTAVIHP
ncbi:hypothetical protein K450DRAFT_259438 [Umbelopsis ramanniana AG]|uniref:Uncharacterized protein n=1 Tax=Umbelopsis ramanniana AG TaxID=1314678 RepID=A0AAD5E1X0_UMBRA|nr:uncharacterized protein K450DRAFT_259438 [Umbelopsis ramanniana AG]KAI8575931.1 hypothetical protein K450DRAFT_259438 [Umbelopsis ramanniana AG]